MTRKQNSRTSRFDKYKLSRFFMLWCSLFTLEQKSRMKMLNMLIRGSLAHAFTFWLFLANYWPCVLSQRLNRKWTYARIGSTRYRFAHLSVSTQLLGSASQYTKQREFNFLFNYDEQVDLLLTLVVKHVMGSDGRGIRSQT